MGELSNAEHSQPQLEAQLGVPAVSESANDPHVADVRLDRQQSYQQFHLGVYISLVTLIIGSTFIAKNKVHELGSLVYLLMTIIVFVMISGMAGGIVLAKIPENTDYDVFLEKRIGFEWPWRRTPVRGGLLPKTWESIEHLSFWCAVISTMAFAFIYWRGFLY